MVYARKWHAITCAVCKEERTSALVSSLTELWEESVRASHHFLSDKDVKNLIPTVREAIAGIETLIVVYNDKPIGFIGIESDKIEMLFILPDYFGCGLGRHLTDIAIDDYGTTFVDVNEQNTKACEFYRHIGFSGFERSETDGQGNPFPIIRMKLVRQSIK